MVKKGLRYKRKNDKNLKEHLMPETTPNVNPDDIEIGDEIGVTERLVKKEQEDH